MGNLQGGISNKPPKKVSDTRPFDWESFIPPYAAYAPMMTRYAGEDELSRVDTRALQELYDARGDLPPLFYMTVDWQSVRARLGVQG